MLPRLNKLARDVTGGMIKIWQNLSFIISILDRIYRYAGFTGSFFTLDGSTLYTYISFEDDKITFCHESWIGDRMGGDQDSGQTPSKYIAVNGEGRGGVMPAKPISIFIQFILAIPRLVI